MTPHYPLPSTRNSLSNSTGHSNTHRTTSETRPRQPSLSASNSARAQARRRPRSRCRKHTLHRISRCRWWWWRISSSWTSKNSSFLWIRSQDWSFPRLRPPAIRRTWTGSRRGSHSARAWRLETMRTTEMCPYSSWVSGTSRQDQWREASRGGESEDVSAKNPCFWWVGS